MERLLGFDGQLLFDSALTALNILILFFALSRLLFDPAKKLLEDRRNRIAGELSGAEERRRQAEQMRKEYEGRLSSAGLEADSLRRDVLRRAREQEAEILRAAKAEAEQILDQAGREIELERRKAQKELREDVAAAAVMVARKALGAAVGRRVHSVLIEETLKEMNEDTWQVW